jgi:hypothetical protein
MSTGTREKNPGAVAGTHTALRRAIYGNGGGTGRGTGGGIGGGAA